MKQRVVLIVVAVFALLLFSACSEETPVTESEYTSDAPDTYPSDGENINPPNVPAEIRVDLSEQGITNERLAEMVASGEIPADVTRLDLGGNSISDVSPLGNLTNLTMLTLWWNQINDISALSGLEHLMWLYLEGNQISDISALSGLGNLRNLSLYDNPIDDWSPVAHILAD